MSSPCIRNQRVGFFDYKSSGTSMKLIKESLMRIFDWDGVFIKEYPKDTGGYNLGWVHLGTLLIDSEEVGARAIKKFTLGKNDFE